MKNNRYGQAGILTAEQFEELLLFKNLYALMFFGLRFGAGGLIIPSAAS